MYPDGNQFIKSRKNHRDVSFIVRLQRYKTLRFTLIVYCIVYRLINDLVAVKNYRPKCGMIQGYKTAKITEKYFVIILEEGCISLRVSQNTASELSVQMEYSTKKYLSITKSFHAHHVPTLNLQPVTCLLHLINQVLQQNHVPDTIRKNLNLYIILFVTVLIKLMQ